MVLTSIKDNAMKQHIALAVAVMGPAGMAAGDVTVKAELPYGAVETYRQTLVVDSVAPGRLPAPRVAPVYDGHKWGLSTRWDDSNPNALNVRRKMIENGIRGTFYLNSRTPETAPDALACKLTGKGECSVGGHSVTHPKLPDLPVNEAFYELMANRIALECLTDRPVNSLAFPYGQYQAKGRPEVLEGITHAVLRTGYLHCVYSGFVLHNPFLPEGVVTTGLQVVPGDRQVDAGRFWAHIEKVRQNDASSRKTSDCIFLGVHPWQQGEELERLGEVMGKLREWDDFWHCTHTEYAAYAKQWQATTVATSAPGIFTLTRPAAFELGDNVALTLVFDSGDVRSAKVDGIDCAVRKVDGKTFVNVPHGPRSAAPTKIDEASDGASRKFPGLRAMAALNAEDGALAVTLENATGATVTDAMLTVSLPPACEPGMLRWRRAEIATGATWAVSAPVMQTREGEYWRSGQRYFVARIDFARDGEHGRLYATLRDE